MWVTLLLVATITWTGVLPARAAPLSDPGAARMLQLVNQHRANNGLHALVWNQALADVAQNWSAQMQADIHEVGPSGFRHNPDYAEQYPAGWLWAAENIAINSDIDALFYAWQTSSGHNMNMLSPWATDFGFGFVSPAGDIYGRNMVATQNFARYPAPDTRVSVIPKDVVFSDLPFMANDTFTIPVSAGVEYRVDGQVVAAGTYPAQGKTVSVSAQALTGYVIPWEAGQHWWHSFAEEYIWVPPADVVFSDQVGTANDTYTIPASEGVDYVLEGRVIAAGTYPGAGTVIVTAQAQPYHMLVGGVTSWTYVFASSAVSVVPAPVLFTDNPGATSDTYTIPTTEGVDYVVGGNVIGTGVYPGLGTVYVRAQARAGYVLAAGAQAAWTGIFITTGRPGTHVPVTPFRALDTRASLAVAGDSSVSFQVGGVNGIPTKVSAVVFNLTATEASSFGFVTAHASGKARPNASNVNYSSGKTAANLVSVPVGADGRVTLFNRSAGHVHLIADVAGYFATGTPVDAGAFKALDPMRALDTRTSKAVGADSSVSFQVAGSNGIPSGVSAVEFNLTVAEAMSFGFVTAHASGTARPNASNINYSTGQIVPNRVTVPVGADGKVTLFNRSAGSVQLIADIAGYYLPGNPTVAGSFKAVGPARFLDTRNGFAAGPDSTVSFRVGGVDGIPANPSAVVFNLTATAADSFGFVTAYPSGTARPNASNVNYDSGKIVPNLVNVPVGRDGWVTLFNRSSGRVQLIADIAGYYLGEP